MLDQVEEGLLSRMDVVEDHRERALRAGVLECLAEGPGELLGGSSRVGLSEKRADRRGRLRVRRQRVELFQHLDHGPAGDPLAVGEAASTDDRCVQGCECLCDEARLPDARVADDRDELATTLGQGPEPELRECVAHLRCRPHCAQRVVLVCGRHAEDRHDGIADELLDRSPVVLDDCLHPSEVAREQLAERLGVDRLPQLGRPGHVAEQDGDRLALHVLMIAQARRQAVAKLGAWRRTGGRRSTATAR